MLKNKRKQLTVMGCFWDFHPLFRSLDELYESKFISFYDPVLRNFIDTNKILCFNESQKNIIFWPLKILFRSARTFYEIFRFRPDLVISHHDDANISMLPIIFLFKFLPFYSPKFILWIRNNPVEMHREGLFSLIARFCYRFFFQLADEVIVQCQRNLQIVSAAYPGLSRNIRIIPNVYDIHQIRKLAGAEISENLESIMAEKFVFINIGRFTSQKGQKYLIRAFKPIAIKYPEAILVILGSGPLESDLKILVSELLLQTRVFFFGYQENPFPILSRSHCFVLSSVFEGFPNVLAESLALNLPVISTNCDTGPEDILTDHGDSIFPDQISYVRYGILVPPFVSEEVKSNHIFLSEKINIQRTVFLTEAMEKIISTPELRERYQNGHKRIADFSIDSRGIKDMLLDL